MRELNSTEVQQVSGGFFLGGLLLGKIAKKISFISNLLTHKHHKYPHHIHTGHGGNGGNGNEGVG